jgi:hypothetical protein
MKADFTTTSPLHYNFTRKGRMKLIRETIIFPDHYNTTAEAVQHRDSLVMKAKECGSAITNLADQTIAATIGSEIQRHLKEVAATRMDLARPLNAAADRLIELEKAFQQAEAARVAAEAKRRQEEYLAAEADRQKAQAQAEKARSAVKQVQAEQRAYEAASVANEILRAPLPAAQKSRGAATKRELFFEVTDINALYAARPDLCNPPTPKASAIKAVCTPESKVPGLRCFWVEKTHFRS